MHGFEVVRGIFMNTTKIMLRQQVLAFWSILHDESGKIRVYVDCRISFLSYMPA